jgi:hypothetical protein
MTGIDCVVMPALSPVLLRLAEAIGPDGEATVPRLLGEALAAVTDFEAAEIVLSHAGRFVRYPITGGEAPIAGDDLLRHLIQGAEPMRVDEPSEAAPYPQTQEAMNTRGFGSLLAVPLSRSGAPAGGLVLARDFSWSLVGVPLSRVVPMAAMAGIALARSRSLAELLAPEAAARRG